VDQNPDRIEQFEEEIAGMQISSPRADQERWALIGGVLAMAVGVACIIGGWWGASGTTVITEAISYAISGGILGLGLIVIGAALFVRYSTSRYLRYWLVRLIYEDQANADRIVDAVRGQRPPSSTGGAGGTSAASAGAGNSASTGASSSTGKVGS
jgi:hypothetical protein